MIAQTQSTSAMVHARRQQIEYRIKQINLELIRLVAERLALVKERGMPPPIRLAVVRRPAAVRPRLPADMTDEQKRQRRLAYMRNYMNERRELGADYVLKQPQRKKRRDANGAEIYSVVRQMVEQGMSREQIAERLGCKVSTLTVQCSKYRISLPKASPVKKDSEQ
jgi:hypothetical protein